MKNKNEKKNKLALYMSFVAFFIFLLSFIYYAYEYYVWWNDGRVAQQNSDYMRQIFDEQVNSFSFLFEPDNIIEFEILNEPNNENIDDYYELYSHYNNMTPLHMARILTDNANIIAYIHIPGTNLSNVVVQTYDNYFYLNHDINHNRNSNGAIFMDYRNSNSFSDRNTIIYGHNMRNGTMFHNIRYYMERDFFEENSIITIITDEAIFIYQAFAAFSTFVDFDYIQVNFNSNYDFLDLINEIKYRSFHPSSISLDYNSQILILSTCTNAHEDERFVLVATLINKIFFLTY